GDLDWIALKCLEKDRTRRYDTAIALATDILRHLNNEPVTAAAPTFRYRAAKFCRRYRKPLAVAAAFAMLLTTATAVSVWQGERPRPKRVRQSYGQKLKPMNDAPVKLPSKTNAWRTCWAAWCGPLIRSIGWSVAWRVGMNPSTS